MAATRSLGLYAVLGLSFYLCLVINAQDEEICKTKGDLCSCDLKSGNGVINLGEIGNSNGSSKFSRPRNLTVDNETVESTFTYNPCYGVLDEPSCQGSSVCLKIPLTVEGTPTDAYTSYGTKTSTTWKNDTATSFPAIAYQNAKGSFTVILKCNSSIPATNSTLTFDEKLYNKVTLESNGCCPTSTPVSSTTPNPVTPDPVTPDPKKSGLSTGSILLILFFVFLILYLVGGIIYKKIVNGAQGKELIPNIEFWTSLPGLVLDGCAFVCNCCGKRKGNTPGYDGV